MPPGALQLRRIPAPAPCPSLLLRCAGYEDRPCALISGPGDPELSGWSYAALEPCEVMPTWEAAERALGGWSADPTAPPFGTGAVGYLGYDQGFERVDRPRPPRPDPLGMPAGSVALYDAVYARSTRTLEGCIVAQPTAEAARRAERLERALSSSGREPVGHALGLSPRVARAEHERRVAQLLELIRDGELYQANLSYAIEGRYQGAPEAAFLRLLACPPPFAAFLRVGDDSAVVSASPECFFDLQRGSLAVYPIKGTRPRAADGGEDRALAAALLADPKDRAEHLMIVDLLRNDLGRVAQIGSVQVERLAYLESFPTVHHLTSRIRARVGALGIGPVLDALFPGGSITGCPKLRAMETIDALEGEGRGVYTGALGYLSPSGHARMSIAIRTASVRGEVVRFGVGGGIVADSVPAKEWEETVVKAQALSAALLG